MNIIKADFSDPNHSEAILKLLNEYALDPMGGGNPLSGHVKANLMKELQKRQGAHAILAFDGETAGLLLI